MKKPLSLAIVFFVSVALAGLFLSPPAGKAANSNMGTWEQTDWSGGPGQALWQDATRYSTSSRIDTRTLPNRMRLSFLSKTFTKNASNPVIPKGPAGSWDEKYIRGFAFVKTADGYQALYNGTDNAATPITAVGYAKSPDGVHWTKSGSNPVLKRSGTETWDQNGIFGESIIRDGSTCHLYFWGDDTAGNNSYGHATSTDLKHWSRSKNPVLSPGAPGSWDEQRITYVTARKIGNTFHIWYLGQNNGGVSRVGHATSTDGETWVKDPANPVLNIGAPGSFDDVSIVRLIVMERSWLGDFLLAYTGSHVGGFGIGIATSPDGTHWTKDPANPKFSTGGATWFSDNIRPSDLTFDGSIYKLGLYGDNPVIKTSSGEAWSEDGSTWNMNANNPLLSPGTAPADWDRDAAEIIQTYLEGNNIRAFYEGYPPFPCYTVGTATAEPSYNASGTLTSSVYDALGKVGWGTMSWTQIKPAGTDVKVEVRCGDKPVPDGTWTGWVAATNGGNVPHGEARYIQYRVKLSSSTGDATPEVSRIEIKAGRTWYLAEGSTGGNDRGSFETWVLVQNPGDAKAEVDLFYQTPTGEKKGPHLTLDPHTRNTVSVGDTVPNEWSVSTRVVSDNPVIAERAMYWVAATGVYRQSATDSIGVPGPAATWYLAEGSTGSNDQGAFETWVLVQNPGNTKAKVDLYYQTPAGEKKGPHLSLDAHTRQTVNVGDTVPNEWSVSTRVVSDNPVIAERAMYWNSVSGVYRQAAADSIGVPSPANSWYLAEGSTGVNAQGAFESWVLVQNPGDDAAKVQLYYQTPTGEVEGQKITLEPHSRETRNVADIVPNEFSVSTRVVSDNPVIAERAMYWNSPDAFRQSATDSIGVPGPATTWYLAEGSTGSNDQGAFETWVLVQNPGDAQAEVDLYYQTPTGEKKGPHLSLDPHTRQTVSVGDTVPNEWSVSTRVVSDNPVIAERAMYWNAPGVYRQAATDSIGFDD